VALGSPTVSMLVDPEGAVNVIATMEQVFCPSYVAIGHSFPQASIVNSALVDAASAIGAQLAALSFIGALLSRSLRCACAMVVKSQVRGYPLKSRAVAFCVLIKVLREGGRSTKGGGAPKRVIRW
jgi:hypothetical protein